MVKKGKSKSKLVTDASPKYEFVSLEENAAVERKNDEFLNAILRSALFFEESVDYVKEFLKEKEVQEEWEMYLKCDHLPKGHSAPQLRNYFFKEIYYNNESIEASFNWMLDINERSVLSQDIDAVDLTRKYLVRNKVHLGEEYDVLVADGVKTLARISEEIQGGNQSADLKLMKTLAQNYIRDRIDRLTYRIISCEKAFLNPIDSITEEYFYHANDFQIHIWALQNVALRFNKENFPNCPVDLKHTHTHLTLPFEVLQHNLVVRSLHLEFDHFSEYSRSFQVAVGVDVVTDLKTSLKSEWASKKEIQTKIRERLIQERKEYEEYLIKKAEEDALKEKESRLAVKDPSKKPKPTKKKGKDDRKKFAVEPPVITSDTYPIVDSDFLEFDNIRFKEYLESMNPAGFGLEEGEINLRQYAILGGVFELEFVKKCQNVVFPQRIMTWHENGSDLQFPGITCLEFNMELGASNEPVLFEVTFQLDRTVCMWGPPLVCQWERGGAQVLIEGTQTASSAHAKAPVRLDDFCVDQMLEKAQVFNMARHLIPRTISSYRFPAEFLSDAADKSSGMKKLFHKSTTTIESTDTLARAAEAKKKQDGRYNPERLFPVFRKAEPLELTPCAEVSPKLSELIAVFDKYERDLQPLFIERKPKVQERPKSVVDFEPQAPQPVVSRRSASKLGRASHQELVRKRNSQRATVSKVVEGVLEIKKKPPKTVVPKWTYKNVEAAKFDGEKATMTVWTQALGTFGFAFNRYIHFPFKKWTLQPDEERPTEAVHLHLENVNCQFEIYITAEGYTARVTDFTKYAKKRLVYMSVDEPESDLKEFKKKFRAHNLNIFPERDAFWYMDGNDLFSEKHAALESHTIECMAVFCNAMKYSRSEWNCLSGRRNILMKFNELKEEGVNLVKVSPEAVQFVDVKELCSELDTVVLEYTPTWKNLGFNPDLIHLFENSYSGILHHKNKDARLVVNLSNLLQSIRLFSFS